MNRAPTPYSAPERMLDIVRDSRLLLAVTLHGPDDWQGLGVLLEQTRIPAVEIMLRSPYAWEGIRRLRQTWPKLVIGVGTVLNTSDLQKSQDEGADFAVSPGMLSELLQCANELNFPYLPGAMSPSELMQIAATNYRAVKFFPAAPLGPEYLQCLAAPFPDLRFCVSGGLEVGNYRQFLRVRQVAGLSGSWPLPRNLSDSAIRNQSLPELCKLVEELQAAFSSENALPIHGVRP